MFLSKTIQKSLSKNYIAKFSTISANDKKITPYNYLEPLYSRQLIQVEGKDAAILLQGLITNDIYDLCPNKLSSLFAMFLNENGRVISDSLIYSLGDSESYLIETNSEIISNLIKHLRAHKGQREVQIKLFDELKVYALYDVRDGIINYPKGFVPEVLQCSKEQSASNGTILKDMYLFCDPRTDLLGYRILANKIEVIHDELYVNKFNPISLNYKWLRYNLGIPEGVIDIPPEKALPLEHNCDYMGGLSKSKGNYLGQELTEESYTGKVHRRVMPLFLKTQLKYTPANKHIYDDSDGKLTHIGYIRGVYIDAGLAVLNFELALKLKMNIGNTIAITHKPLWWPGSHKQKLSSNEVMESLKDFMKELYVIRNFFFFKKIKDETFPLKN